MEEEPNNKTLGILLESHRRFLAYLERRVGSREIAEEIQSAFAKAVEREDSLKEETVVAWFYRLLRNALVDHYRRRDAEQRALDARRQEAQWLVDADPESERTVCECFRDLLPTLKPEYSGILQQVDLGNQSVGEVAESLGITPNNASVRLHRARLALKNRLEQTCRTCAQHGCYDCTCGSC